MQKQQKGLHTNWTGTQEPNNIYSAEALRQNHGHKTKQINWQLILLLMNMTYDKNKK